MPRIGLAFLRAEPPVVGRRDLRVDLLRGFAVLAMVVDHVGGASPLYALTGGNRFFVSAAEGFVFISGLLVGMVYGGELRREGWRAGAGKALRRAFTLYALSVWLTLGFAAFSTLVSLPWAPDPDRTHVGRFVLNVLAFHRTYYLVDVMQLYALLLLATPLALWLLGRGKWRWLLAASLALWAGYQLSGGRLQIPWRIRDNLVFNFAAWQVLFFGAMALGYQREAAGCLIGRLKARLALALPGGALVPLAVVLAGLIWLHRTNGAVLARVGLTAEPAAILDVWFNKAALPPLRLAAAAVVFAFAWSLTSRGWPLIQPALGRLLLPLGRKALAAYAIHLFVAGTLQLLTPLLERRVVSSPGPDEATGLHLGLGPGTSLVLQVIALAAIWLLVRWTLPQRLVGWLGAQPVQVVGRSWRRLAGWRPAPSLVALAAASLVGASTLGLTWPDLTPLPPPNLSYWAATPSPVRRPRVEVTVTARRLADLGARPADQTRALIEGSASPSPATVAPTPRPEPTPAATALPTPAATTPPASTARPSVVPTRAPAEPTAVADIAKPRPTSPPTPRPAPTSTPAPAGEPVHPSGSVLEDRTFFSPTLGRTMPYGIYLPPGYFEQTGRHYPVVYLLHGGPTDYSEWAQYGIGSAEDDLLAAGEGQPFIMVFPEGEGSYFFNHQGGPAWGDYVAHDLVRYIDATERTIPDRASRAIGGLSMGGHGALQLTFNYPDVFGVVGAHAPSLRTYDDGLDFFGPPDYYQLYDPMALARVVERRPLAIWLDTGEEDPWVDRVQELHEIFHERGWRHELRVYPGSHVSEYWIDHAPDYVRFYSDNLAAVEEIGMPVARQAGGSP